MVARTRDLPLTMVGSNKFGRYRKISAEQTWNMYVSDGWLVTYPGYEIALSASGGIVGRGLFNSSRSKKMIMVVDDVVYEVDTNLFKKRVGNLETFTGDVFIDENDAHQIGICDKKNIYIYSYLTGSFAKAVTPTLTTLDFVPGYICFQDGYFIAPDLANAKWRLSNLNDGTTWPAGTTTTGLFQTKPDNPVACVRIPGKENQLMVIGSTVTQFWTDVGYRLFPYQKNTGYNIDYGCLSPDTIASGDSFVIWLGSNEKSGLSIMMTSGGAIEQISTDGINFVLAQLKHPDLAYGFLIKIDGHLFYQITFPHASDNLSYIYDLNTKSFYSVSDEKMNCHIAKQAVFFNGDYYFISLNNGNLYRMSSLITTYDGNIIPRIRITPTSRAKNSLPFIINRISFPLEQGHGVNQKYMKPKAIKGNISLSEDFPVKTGENAVSIGDAYLIPQDTTVVDSDSTKTYTLQTFYSPPSASGDKTMIVWNGFNWDVVNNNTIRIDASFSYDGAESFGSPVEIQLNREGVHKNIVSLYGLGSCNEISSQFRFWGNDRFVVSDGIMSIYQ